MDHGQFKNEFGSLLRLVRMERQIKAFWRKKRKQRLKTSRRNKPTVYPHRHLPQILFSDPLFSEVLNVFFVNMFVLLDFFPLLFSKLVVGIHVSVSFQFFEYGSVKCEKDWNSFTVIIVRFVFGSRALIQPIQYLPVCTCIPRRLCIQAGCFWRRRWETPLCHRPTLLPFPFANPSLMPS